MSKKQKALLIVVLVVIFGIAAVLVINSFWKRGNGMLSYQMKEDYSYDMAGMEMEESFAMPRSGDSQSLGDVADRLIIRTGEISMIVKDVRGAIKAISDYATEKGGFVVSSSIEKEDIDLYGWITVRVPVEVFDEGVEEFKAMGEVESEKTWGEDVTEEYVDLEARLGNLEATEKQFLSIMDKAQKVEDILAVQRELTWVRGEIERIEGRMKYLEESAALSTLTVYLSTDPSVLPVVDDEEIWKPFAVFKNAVRSLLDFGKGLVDGLIWVVVYIPVMVVVILVFWGIVRLAKRIFRKKKK